MHSSLDQETLEYRWMAAAAAALACCAIGLVAATIMLTTGDRFEFRPPPSDFSRKFDPPEIARQNDVGENQADLRVGLEKFERGIAIACLAHRIAELR